MARAPIPESRWARIARAVLIACLILAVLIVLAKAVGG